MAELPRELVLDAAVIVDSSAFCSAEAGELIAAFGTADETSRRVIELGLLLDNPDVGPRAGSTTTIYKSVGNAGQDLYAAELALRRLTDQRSPI